MHPALKKLGSLPGVFFAATLWALVLLPVRVAAQESNASAPDYSKTFDKIDAAELAQNVAVWAAAAYLAAESDADFRAPAPTDPPNR